MGVQSFPLTRAGRLIRPGGEVVQHLVRNSRSCRCGAWESPIRNSHGSPFTFESPSGALPGSDQFNVAMLQEVMQVFSGSPTSLHDSTYQPSWSTWEAGRAIALLV